MRDIWWVYCILTKTNESEKDAKSRWIIFYLLSLEFISINALSGIVKNEVNYNIIDYSWMPKAQIKRKNEYCLFKYYVLLLINSEI